MGFPHTPHERETLVLSKHFGVQEAIGLDGWRKRGGYDLDRGFLEGAFQIIQRDFAGAQFALQGLRHQCALDHRGSCDNRRGRRRSQRN